MEKLLCSYTASEFITKIINLEQELEMTNELLEQKDKVILDLLNRDKEDM